MPIHDWTRVDAGIFHDFHHDWIFTLKCFEPRSAAGRLLCSGGADRWRTSPRCAYAGQRDRPASTANGGTWCCACACLRGKVAGRGPAGCPLHRLRRNASVWWSATASPFASADQVVAIIEIVSPGNKAGRHALRALSSLRVPRRRRSSTPLGFVSPRPARSAGYSWRSPGPRSPKTISTCPKTDNLPWPVTRREKSELLFIEPVAVGVELPAMLCSWNRSFMFQYLWKPPTRLLLMLSQMRRRDELEANDVLSRSILRSSGSSNHVMPGALQMVQHAR